MLRRLVRYERVLWSATRGRWAVAWECKPADCWRGFFPRYTAAAGRWDVWIVLVPMLPIHVRWQEG